ncbi:hypothetical protein CPB84DRAFT_1848523 [Gymnopilus junonius]|uniref:Uncharacterized protein n=1 Tax=Gymnopilus junonius TaxID=109634 RepID=A0A9P5NMK5_GYMJU|nr:hypothetical protein CPB84DRAFT_1848523 [Gymnopilus junonius]
MGNSCSCVTEQQVTDALKAQLLDAAKDQLQKEFDQTLPDNSSLQDYTSALSKAYFKKQFEYDWDPTNPKPPKLEPINPRIHAATDYCIINGHQDLRQGVAAYVADGLESVHLDDWMKVIGKFANYPCDNEWHDGTYSETYDSKNPGTDSYRFDVSLLYTNATRTDSAVEATLHILFFVGVYYTVSSPAAETFHNLQSKAYTAAASLPNVTQSPIVNDVDLKKALYQYNAPNFKDKWQYDYNTGKPSDFATDESEPIFSKNQDLAYFNTRTLTDDQIDTYVQLHIMDGIHITVPDGTSSGEGLDVPFLHYADPRTLFASRVEGRDVKSVIAAQFKHVLGNPDSGGWKYTELDKTFGVGLASWRPIRINALMAYYSSSATIIVENKDVTVDMIYVYFFGIVYELQPDPIIQDMTRSLCKNIPGISPNEIPKHITPTQLTNFIEKFNVAGFDKQYGFHFPDDDTGMTPKIKYWRAFFEFQTHNPLRSDIEDKIEKQIFGPDDKVDEEIKHHLQKSVYDFMVNYFADVSGTAYPKTDNEWYSIRKQNSFSYEGHKNSNWDLQARTSWAYANAKMTEDGQGGETVQYFYLSLLLYITADEDEESDSDV